MNITDVAHLLSLWPLLVEAKGDREEIKRRLRVILPCCDIINDYRIDYLIYCLESLNGKRDYNLLRKYLKTTVEKHENVISSIIYQMLFDNGHSAFHGIKKIYDIGAAHSAYSNIFKTLFRSVSIYLVDKDPSCLSGSTNIIVGDIHENISMLEQGPHVLYFMSEFLHCKRDNILLLEKLRTSNILVNEVIDPVIDLRLRMTGGGVITTDHLRFYGFNNVITYYMNDMLYYMSFRKAE